MKEEKESELLEQYNAFMDGYEPLSFVSGDWPMENGVYRQYSAFEESNNSIGGISYIL